MKATWTLTAGNEDDLVDHVYLYLEDGACVLKASLKRHIRLQSKRFKLRNARRALLQAGRTDAPLVTMCCMASCTTDAMLVASYYSCIFHSLRPAAMIGSSNDDLIHFHGSTSRFMNEETTCNSLLITCIAIAEGRSQDLI